jgi:glutathione S-transferase
MKLYYFDVYGRGEGLRMLLWHAKVQYEDVRLSEEDFAKLKTEGTVPLEFGQVPVIENEGKFYNQTQSMMRSLGKMHGYYPEDPYTAYQVDSILDSIHDLAVTLLRAKNEKDEDKKKEMLTAAITTYLPNWLSAHEKRVEKNGQENTLVGDKLTIADIQFAALLSSAFYNEGNPYAPKLKEVYETFPKLWNYASNLEKVFKEYLAARPSPRPL